MVVGAKTIAKAISDDNEIFHSWAVKQFTLWTFPTSIGITGSMRDPGDEGGYSNDLARINRKIHRKGAKDAKKKGTFRQDYMDFQDDEGMA